MRSRLHQIGDDLALRIPPDVASRVQIGVDSEVEMSVEAGRLVISPVPCAAASLDELLAGVTEENVHREWDTGPPVEREAW